MKTITGTIPASFLRLVGEEAQNKRAFAMIERPVRGVALKSFRPSDDYLRLIGHPAAKASIAEIKARFPLASDSVVTPQPLARPQEQAALDPVPRQIGLYEVCWRTERGESPWQASFSYWTGEFWSLTGSVEYATEKKGRKTTSRISKWRPAERAEYAPEVKGDGWIEWEGGECPVPRGTPLMVKLRSGSVYSGEALVEAEAMRGDVFMQRNWTHGFPAQSIATAQGDIIAYRLA